MSKSISGLGTTDLTINELRLLGATFTTLNTSDLIVAGTAQIGNIVISGTFNVGQLTADAVTTPELIASGTISIKALNNTTDTTDNKIAFIQGGTDTGILKTSTNLYYNPSTDELGAGEFIGNVTGEVNIQTTTPTNTGAFRVPFIDGVNDGVTSTGNGLMSSSNKLRFDESTGTLIISNYVTVPILAVTTYAMITPTTSTADIEYKVTMFGNGNALTGDTMTYNCFQNRLTVPKLQVTGELHVAQKIYANLLYMAHDVSITADETAKIIFKRPTDDILASTGTFAYNPGQDKLLCGGAEFEGEVKFNNVANPVADGTNREVLMLGGSNILVRDASFTYNMLDNQLNTPKANITTTLTANDAVVEGDLEVAGDTTINTLSVTGNLTVTAPITTETDNNRVTFIEAKAVGGTTDYGTGILSRGNLYFNNDNETLFCKLIWGQELVYTPKLRVMPTAGSGLPSGEFTIDGSNGLTANQATSFSVRVNSGKRFQIQEAQTTFFNDVVMNNNLTVNGSVVYTNVAATEFRNTISDLPIGYTTIYSCDSYDTNNGNFGMDAIVVLNNQASQGGNPTVKQFGANVSLTYGGTVIRSAIDFGQSSNRIYWSLNGWLSGSPTNQKYAGCWEVRVSATFQNLSSSRITPKIIIKKWNGTAYIDQPQITSPVGYTKSGNGSLISLVCQGVVYMTHTNALSIYTRADVNSIPVNTNYPDTVSNGAWAGHDLVISMKYLGFQSTISNAL